MKKPMIWMVLALVLGFGLIFGSIEGKKYVIQRYLAGFTPPPVTVSTQIARAENWSSSITAVGSLKAVQGVDIATETAGIVSAVLFKPGDEIARATELVSLDDRVEVATLKSLAAQRRLAEINFERDQRLLGSHAISRTDFDKTEAQLKDITAQVEKTQALIDRKHLRAPFAGRIGIALVDPGQYVVEGQFIVTLQALDTLEVDFSLPEQHLPRLAVGQEIRCEVQAYPDQGFEGKVIAIDAKVDGSKRNVLVRAHVPNTALSLLPGMFVSVDVILDKAVAVVTVPETALSYNLYGDSVFVVKSKQNDSGKSMLTVQRHYVQTGDSQRGRVAIVKGLAVGEQVVTAGALKLDAGAAVMVDNSVDLGR